MKRGGEEIYVGPLGRHSCQLIKYFEVSSNEQEETEKNSLFLKTQMQVLIKMCFCFVKGIVGVSKIKDGYNPATWMLEVTTMAQEEILGINFTELYKNSDLHR